MSAPAGEAARNGHLSAREEPGAIPEITRLLRLSQLLLSVAKWALECRTTGPFDPATSRQLDTVNAALEALADARR
ncbi:MAG: hypothetical protein AABZ64_16490 [Nitrospinota bacterium]